MGENLEGPEWASIAEAARDEKVPLRTLYRWVKSGAVASKMEGGVTLVRLADVRARAGRGRAETATPANGAATAVANAGVPAGTTAGNGTVAGKAATVAVSPSPELVARLFRLFDEGMALEAIVQREQLLPQTVLDAHRQFESLLAAGGRPSLGDRMAAHEEETTRRFVGLDGYFRGVASEFEFHAQRLSDGEKRIGVLGEKLQAAALEQLWQRVQKLEELVAYLISRPPLP